MRDEVTDADADGETENASEEEVGAEITFSGRKLSVKTTAFPLVRPPVGRSARPLSFLTRARPSFLSPFPCVRPSVSPLPIRQSLVRSPFAFPAREKSTRMYAKRRTRSHRGPCLGRSRGKILGAFVLQRRPTHRWRRNRTSDSPFASLIVPKFSFPSFNAVSS